MASNILVTGANGFVGQALIAEAVSRGISVRSSTRQPCIMSENVENAVVGDIDNHTDWQNALNDCEVVFHLAGRAHVMRDKTDDPLAEFRKINVAATEHLAYCAAACGVRRLVYVSSIKVNGEETPVGHGFSEQSLPSPQDFYGISKLEAELVLQRIATETGLEVVIVRPPLIYGAGVKGNFAHLMRAIDHGILLPFGSVQNQRDLIYVGNLVDALLVCSTQAVASGQTYLVSDGESISTPDLVRVMAKAMDTPSHILKFPLSLLKIAGKMTGKSKQIERLIGSLRVDSSKIRRELNWVPPYTLQHGLQSTAAWYRIFQ